MLQAGQVITLSCGPYTLQQQLAGSAYGLIWRATSATGAQVALKLINRAQMARAQSSLQARWVASAEKEIGFLASLAPWDERHIVRLLDHGIHEGLPVMALELMNTDLARHVASERASGRALPFGHVLDWIGQVNQALAKVHQYGWLHLDLKPANVLVSERSGGVRLADFGSNRQRGEAPSAFYAGTASWQAPEQFFPTAQRTWDTDERSDYFALGAMFFYLVTGGVQLRFCTDCGNAYRDYQAHGSAALLARHGGSMPPTIQEDEETLFTHRIARHANAGAGMAGCPAGVNAARDLLKALLAQDRNDRPRNGIDISRRLDAIRHAIPRYASPRAAIGWAA